ncbi:hypothetical protein MKZ15_15370 [Paenibacillus sp. FSL R7-0216]|uniref:hypothetical protein n=1 Tax=Paenibacillus sp. FSL R7-0216 TaxID=2921677 RepID=UPI0030DD49AA
MLRCCVVLSKTQYEIENEYYFIDLPELLMLKDQVRASEMLEQIDIVAFPHNSDKEARKAIVNRYVTVLPKPPTPKPKSAQEQYEALKLRMKGR